MEVVLLALLGAVVNRHRGSGFPYSQRRGFRRDPGGVQGAWTFLPAGAAAMYLGQSLGWGRYIGALGGRENEELKEVAFIAGKSRT